MYIFSKNEKATRKMLAEKKIAEKNIPVSPAKTQVNIALRSKGLDSKKDSSYVRGDTSPKNMARLAKKREYYHENRIEILAKLKVNYYKNKSK